ALAAGAACLLTGILAGMLAPAVGLAAFIALSGVGAAVTLRIMRASALTAARRTRLVERMRAATIDLVSGQTPLLMAGQLDAQRYRVLDHDAGIAAADRRLKRLETAAGAVFTGLGGIILGAHLVRGAHL